MQFGPALNEIVLFEVPDAQSARGLFAYVAPRRLAWHQRADEGSIVGVVLNPDADDLALLLRAVQAWMEGVSLAAIRFELDGRTYVLEPAYAEPAAG
jgi:hypothetical protein